MSREAETASAAAARHTALHSALERQETELKVLFDLMPALIWFKDTENRILRVNQRVVEMAGRPVEEIEGRPSKEIYPIDAEKYYADDLEVIRAGVPKLGIVERLIDAGGEERWVLTDKVPVLDAAGKVVGIVVMARDITEGKRATEAVRESEERFTTAFEHAPIGVALISLDFRWLKVNRALCDLFGYTEAELLTHTVQDLTHPDDVETALGLQTEKRYIHKSGHAIVGLLSLSLVNDATGTPQYFVGHIQDITARRAAEDELRSSASALWASASEQRELAVQLEIERSRLVDAQKVTKVGSWELDLLTMSVHWSDEMHHIYEIDFGPMTTDRIFAGVHPDDRENLTVGFRQSVSHRSPRTIEHRLLLPDGRVKYLEQRWRVELDDRATPVRAIGTCQDITERKQSEIALGQSQQHLRDIIDGLGPSMFVGLLTPAGVLVEINRPPLEAAGLRAEDVLGKPFVEAPWWSHSTEVQRQLREAIVRAANGEASRFDVQNSVADGKVIDLDFSLQPLRDASGEVVFLIPSGSVVTERNRAEAALRQAQKLEAVGQLAAGVAHEFNNILQTLMSMATITRLRAESPEAVKVAGEMEVQIRRGSSVTRQLLLAARFQEPAKTSIDIREQVAEARDLLRRLIPENIAIILETCDEMAAVEGDASQLQQVLLNLAINARDAMSHGGTLTLRVTTNAAEVVFDIEDTGVGFDADTRDHLFEPFFTTKEVGKGTGLGLAVVYGIVRQHGGRIEVQSHVGQGSLFRVFLPRTDHAPVAKVSEIPITAATGRILLVEDEQGVRDGLSSFLEIIGYEVIAVSHGEEAMALPATPIPDQMLTDVALSGIGGPALAQILLERWPSMKITLMTGYVDAATHALAAEHGWHILQKPFELATLGKQLTSHTVATALETV